MPWTKSPNVAMYELADWGGYLKTQPNCSPERARRISLLDPNITFYFFCREFMVLTNPSWPSDKEFSPGDAVFFKGKPVLGSAPQCDIYEKSGISIAYISPESPEIVASAGCYTTADGAAAVDVVCIFAANINQSLPTGYTLLAPEVAVPNGGSIACGNSSTLQTLQSPAIRDLQAKGITVLLTFLNNHDASGWSQFSTESDAQTFVFQLQSVVDTYGLDGIDIDDEYSTGTSIPDSLAMVTSMMRNAMPDKIISKALFEDSEYFGVPYEGVTLEQTLTYGWEMTYAGAPEDRLPQYVDLGMAKSALALGFWSGQPSEDPISDVDWLKSNGYAGFMVYSFNDTPDQELMGTLIDAWLGSGNWNKISNSS